MEVSSGCKRGDTVRRDIKWAAESSISTGQTSASRRALRGSGKYKFVKSLEEAVVAKLNDSDGAQPKRVDNWEEGPSWNVYAVSDERTEHKVVGADENSWRELGGLRYLPFTIAQNHLN